MQPDHATPNIPFGASAETFDFGSTRRNLLAATGIVAVAAATSWISARTSADSPTPPRANRTRPAGVSGSSTAIDTE
jgi:hypothetical protein